MAAFIDLNADLGEECGDDAAMLEVVTSANIATGGHAGGGAVMVRAMVEAIKCDVAVGAHPSYPDRDGFGRVSMAADLSSTALAEFLSTQLDEAVRAASSVGTELVSVKPHGALYHDANQESKIADVVARLAASACLALVGPPVGCLRESATRHGVRYVAEGFADRRYDATGALLARSAADAVLTDHESVVQQARELVLRGGVTASDGTWIPLAVDTICLHGDTPGSVSLAQHVRSELQQAGVIIARWDRRYE